MENVLDDIVYSENVTGFTALATQFCSMLDNTALMSQQQFIDKAHRLLPLIYLKAIILPDLEPVMPDMIEKEVTREEWEAVFETVKNKLKNHDTYTEVFDSLNYNHKPEKASLAESFADIYQDLRDFTVLYATGSTEIMNDAVWQVKQSFRDYWGQRLVNIVRVLHFLLYNNTNLNTTDALTLDDFDIEKRVKHNQ